MVTSCIVKSCKSVWAPHSNVSYFSFKKDKKMLEKWLQLIPDLTEVKDHHKICSKHFRPEFIQMRLGRTYLTNDAIPTIFDKENMPDELQSNTVPMETNIESMPFQIQSQSMPIEIPSELMPIEANFEAIPVAIKSESPPIEIEFQSLRNTVKSESPSIEIEFEAIIGKAKSDGIPIKSDPPSLLLKALTDTAPLLSKGQFNQKKDSSTQTCDSNLMKLESPTKEMHTVKVQTTSTVETLESRKAKLLKKIKRLQGQLQRKNRRLKNAEDLLTCLFDFSDTEINLENT